MTDPMNALKHVGQGAAYAPAWKSTRGVWGGWMWATDTATLAAVPTDADDDDPFGQGARVAGMLADLPTATHLVRLGDLQWCGGLGVVPGWGYYDLDRVVQAALWVAGVVEPETSEDPDLAYATVDVAVMPHRHPHPLSTVLVLRSGDRVAKVCGCTSPDGWCPTIDLPLAPLAETAP